MNKYLKKVLFDEVNDIKDIDNRIDDHTHNDKHPETLLQII